MLLGAAPVDLSRILEAIVPGFPFRGTRGDRRVAVKRALERLGKALNYSVFYSEPRENGRNHEFVLDLAWWNPGQGLVFAVECEWGNAGSAGESFKKLLALKAPLKLLVFATRLTGSERQDITLREDTEAFLEVLGQYTLDFTQHVRGERYLLLELTATRERFQAYEFTVPHDGQLTLPRSEAGAIFQPVALAKTAGA